MKSAAQRLLARLYTRVTFVIESWLGAAKSSRSQLAALSRAVRQLIRLKSLSEQVLIHCTLSTRRGVSLSIVAVYTRLQSPLID